MLPPPFPLILLTELLWKEAPFWCIETFFIWFLRSSFTLSKNQEKPTCYIPSFYSHVRQLMLFSTIGIAFKRNKSKRNCILTPNDPLMLLKLLSFNSCFTCQHPLTHIHSCKQNHKLASKFFPGEGGVGGASTCI